MRCCVDPERRKPGLILLGPSEGGPGRPLGVFHVLVHREKHFHIDSCSPIGPGSVDRPSQASRLQAAHALCHTDSASVSHCGIRHALVQKAKIPHRARKLRHAQQKPSGNCDCNSGSRQRAAERTFSGRLQPLKHSPGCRGYCR